MHLLIPPNDMRDLPLLNVLTSHSRPPRRRIFLAGWVTGDPSWLEEAVDFFKHTHHVIMNPHRPGYLADDPASAREQVAWEDRHMALADDVLFWFSKGAAARWHAEFEAWVAFHRRGSRSPRLFVGCHPEYPRVEDVKAEAAWVRLTVRDSLPELLKKTRDMLP